MSNISNFPVMKSQCNTCPFRLDKNGKFYDTELVNSITSRLLQVSQICHHPRLQNKEETHLCRGARDWQIQIMHRLGVIDEPTDESWEQKRKELNA